MSGSFISSVNCGVEKLQSSIKNSSKKPSEAEIQNSPIILLTVEYPDSGKLVYNYSKPNVQTVDLTEADERAESLPYSLLQLGDAINRDPSSSESYEGNIEVDASKLGDGFSPVLVIRNEGSDEVPGTSSSASKTNPSEQSILNNFFFSPLPKSVVCTVMPKDSKEKDIFTQDSLNCEIVEDTNEEYILRRFEDVCSDDDSEHVISDKPVTCRALASLPANFLVFGKTTSKRCQGVFAKKEVPLRSRFGPMEGTLIPFDASAYVEHLQYTVDNNGSLQQLDVSNENTSNWMRYVRDAESVDEQNLDLYQAGKCLYFRAVRRILPGEELKAWYSTSYAKLRNLPLLHSRRKPVKQNKITSLRECPSGKENIADPQPVNDILGSKWKCTHCQRGFRSATLFNLHVLTHAADNLEITENSDKLLSLSNDSLNKNNLTKKTYACSYCDKTFPCNTTLAVHLRTHTNSKVFECPICREIFCKVPQFKEHIHSHAIDGVFYCPLCSKRFSEYKPIRGHMRRFHSEKNFVCVQCSKRFPTLDKMKIHLLSHSDYREFSCAMCEKRFKRKDKLSYHIKKKCGVKKDSTEKKKPENYTSYLYNCHICVLGFKRRGMLVNHLAARHPEVSLQSIPALNIPILKDSKNYYCQYCGKIYKSSTKRKAHIVKNHPGKKLPPSKLTRPSLNDNPEKNETYSQTVGSVTKLPQGCQWCYKQYASKAKLLQHQRKKHPNQLPKSLLVPKRPSGYCLEDERDAVRDAVEKVTDSDIFLSDPLELSEYELSVGDGEYIIDANTLKRAIKGDVLPVDCSPESLAELGQIIETRPDGYFKVYQAPSGITVAQPVEVWDPLSLCLSPPSSHLLPSSS